jgi:hypothetical protein
MVANRGCFRRSGDKLGGDIRSREDCFMDNIFFPESSLIHHHESRPKNKVQMTYVAPSYGLFLTCRKEKYLQYYVIWR